MSSTYHYRVLETVVTDHIHSVVYSTDTQKLSTSELLWNHSSVYGTDNKSIYGTPFLPSNNILIFHICSGFQNWQHFNINKHIYKASQIRNNSFEIAMQREQQVSAPGKLHRRVSTSEKKGLNFWSFWVTGYLGSLLLRALQMLSISFLMSQFWPTANYAPFESNILKLTG